jgi:hypothetical protein
MSKINGFIIFCIIDVDVYCRFFKFIRNNQYIFFEKYILAIFLTSTIGLFAGKGKTSHVGYLSFAWWVASVALAFSFISAIALTILSFYIAPIPTINHNKM